MRVQKLSSSVRVFLNPGEIETLVDCAPNRRTKIGVLLQSHSSPRPGAVVEIRAGGFERPYGTELWFVKIPDAKDTTEESPEGDGCPRKTYVPENVYQQVKNYVEDNNLAVNDPIIDVGYDQYRENIIEMCEKAAEKTGKDGFLQITPHDFRRFYANDMLRRRNVDKEILMFLGGWSSEEAIKPYLEVPTFKEVQDELALRGVAQKDVDPPERMRVMQPILEEVKKLRKEMATYRVNEAADIDITAERLKKAAEELKEKEKISATEQTDMSQWVDDERKSSVGVVGSLVLAYDSTAESLGNNVLNIWDRIVGYGPFVWAQDSVKRRAAVVASFWTGMVTMLAISFASDRIYINPVTGTASGIEMLAAMLLLTVFATPLLLREKQYSL